MTATRREMWSGDDWAGYYEDGRLICEGSPDYCTDQILRHLGIVRHSSPEFSAALDDAGACPPEWTAEFCPLAGTDGETCIYGPGHAHPQHLDPAGRHWGGEADRG